MISITHSFNLIKNIGISENATHTSSNPLLLPHKTRKLLTQPSYQMEGAIKHPPCIVRDVQFEALSRKTVRYPKLFAKIEVAIRRLWFSILKK